MARDTNLETMLDFVSIPKRTIERVVSKMRKIIAEDDVIFEDITTEIMCPNSSIPCQKKSLIGDNNLNFLQEIIKTRDEENNGMGRSEVITLVGEIV